MSIFQLPSPTQEIKLPLYQNSGLKVYIKRDDLIHPTVSGNKWRKLKWFIQYALDNNYEGVLSFGGAYSNHLHATAYACKHFQLKCKAVLRGELIDETNPTLKDIIEQGAKLLPVSREVYRMRNDTNYLKQLSLDHPGFLILPEGGYSDLGKKGVSEIWDELTYDIDHMIVPVGSATTFAGLINSRPKSINTQLHGILSVKDKSLKERLGHLNTEEQPVSLYDQYTRGGFAKVDSELILFINQFKEQTAIQLEPIYTAKMFLAFHQMIDTKKFQNGETVLLVHTGGLQGIRGHNLRYADQAELLIN